MQVAFLNLTPLFLWVKCESFFKKSTSLQYNWCIKVVNTKITNDDPAWLWLFLDLKRWTRFFFVSFFFLQLDFMIIITEHSTLCDTVFTSYQASFIFLPQYLPNPFLFCKAILSKMIIANGLWVRFVLCVQLNNSIRLSDGLSICL